MRSEYSPENFVESAREFALTALTAYRDRQYRRLAIDAGTALEHLAKACLAKRSPGLLSELKGEDSFGSLLQLLGVPAGSAPRRMRTVGNRNALARVKRLVPSKASEADLATIIDMRDGTVHAAQSAEVEDRLVVAFVQHANALLTDLGHLGGDFWGRQKSVVNELLADASNKTKHRVPGQDGGSKGSVSGTVR